MSEKLIVKLDSQILNSANLCAERYNLEHIGNWRPLKKAAALEHGSVMHKILAHYYGEMKKGRSRSTEHHKLVDESIVAGRLAATHMNISMLDVEKDEATFKDYILRWQYDGWEILDVEQPFSKILYEDDTPIELNGKIYDGLLIIYEGIVDLRVIDPKVGQAVVDSKTESRKSYPFILSNQFQGYEWAFNVPVIVNKIGFQTSLPTEEKFRRPVHESGPVALAEWVSDSVGQVKDIISWHQTGIFRKNRTSCDKYSGCIFQKVCAVPKEVRPHKLQAYFYVDKPWDPYTRDDDESKVADELVVE